MASSYAGRAALEAAGHSRAVERDDAAAAADERQQRRQVAVADERLARTPNVRGVQPRQHLNAAVAAADSHDRVHRIIAERGANRRGPRLGCAGDEAVAVEHRRLEDRLEAETPEFGDAGFELLAGERARRGHDGDAVAGAKRARA